ncbi:LytTR family DNA-binding domain-containing protein [Cytophagaceae bacterium YF14B1]|uniref:LytTR family DNA-binding domain-containing protein n=1 Tax=Xanthocytophaga flava TaxID=3048013 RepID=A0AAE3QUB6_9BACT|nr:LytTR family DNA-binding domain-containing protein [Xanthocytophaga flavus]MDJ1485607.1 LytTR family DNA-binding domain-containing protein [Xanthocytophaga flavus]
MKKSLRCIIIDDEPLAQQLLERFIERVPYLSLVGKFDNAISAINEVTDLQADILFLDINMPEMSGLEFLDTSAGNRPNVILTTAYPQFALQGYDHNVTDYLLKPFSFVRFMKGVQKVLDRTPIVLDNTDTEAAVSSIDIASSETVKKEVITTLPDTSLTERFFMVKEDKKLIKVNLTDIVFVEGMKDYVKIHMFNKFIVTHITMSRISELLQNSAFIRINRSYIVKISFIKLVEGNMIEMTNGKKLPIGINYRDAVREALQNWIL